MARDEGQAEREALRRRLYAPDASDADRARYAAVDRADRPLRTAVGAPPAPRRRRIGTLPIVLLVSAVAVTGLGVGWAATRTARPAVTAPTAITMGAEDRGELEDGLANGGAAGIAAYLVTHQTPPALAHATRFDTVERWGVGSASVSLSPVAAEAVEGRATVLLVLANDGDAGWTAFRQTADPAGGWKLAQQARRGGEQQAGVLTTSTFRYPTGERPLSLRITAPNGARWGVAVVFSD